MIALRSAEGRIIGAARWTETGAAIRVSGVVERKMEAASIPREKIGTEWLFRVDLPLFAEVGTYLPDFLRALSEQRPAWAAWVETEERRHRELREARSELVALSGSATLPVADTFDALPSSHPWHRLRPYQQAGVRWLRRSHGRTLLGDDMGLGKTIQTLVYLGLAGARRTVVVCPAVVVGNWRREAAAWWPEVTWLAVGKLSDLERFCASPPAEPFAVSLSWGLLRSAAPLLAELSIDTIVADEVHYAANPESQRASALLQLGLSVERRIGLTGTEIRNRPRELWPLLRFVDPLRFRVFTRFAERFCGPKNKVVPGPGNTRRKLRDYSGSSNLPELNELLRGYALRREKRTVLSEVPAKSRQMLVIDTSLRERKKVAQRFEEIRLRIGQDGTAAQRWAMGQLTELRREAGLSKVDAALAWLDEARANGEPVVVWFHHQEVRERLEEGLKERGVGFAAIVGATDTLARPVEVERFQRGEVDVILCSTAAKEGITLTRAAMSLHVERFWVPADEEQAEDRICRMGQTRPVVNTYLHLDGSLDDYVARIVEEKRSILTALHDRTMAEHLLDRLGRPA